MIPPLIQGLFQSVGWTLSLLSTDSRIICYPQKTYFKKVKMLRATTELWYIDTNFKAYSGNLLVHTQNFWALWTRFARHMDKSMAIRNHWELQIPQWSDQQKDKRCAWPTGYLQTRYGLYQVLAPLWVNSGYFERKPESAIDRTAYHSEGLPV